VQYTGSSNIRSELMERMAKVHSYLRKNLINYSSPCSQNNSSTNQSNPGVIKH